MTGGRGDLAHIADERMGLFPSNLRSCDLQGGPPAGGSPWSGSEVRLCLWSLMLEAQLSSSSSLWVVLIKLIFALLEPKVSLVMMYSYSLPFQV